MSPNTQDLIQQLNIISNEERIIDVEKAEMLADAEKVIMDKYLEPKFSDSVTKRMCFSASQILDKTIGGTKQRKRDDEIHKAHENTSHSLDIVNVFNTYVHKIYDMLGSLSKVSETQKDVIPTISCIVDGIAISAEHYYGYRNLRIQTPNGESLVFDNKNPNSIEAVKKVIAFIEGSEDYAKILASQN